MMKHYPDLIAGYSPQAIVLANGDFPTRGIALDIMERWARAELDCPLICCDGAMNKLAQLTDRLPTLVVGDLDSVSPEQRARLRGHIRQIPEQETNDLTKAIRLATTELGLRDLTLLGASGGREDHLFANISLLPSFAGLVDELVMITDAGYFRLIDTASTFALPPETPLSVFTLGSGVITLQGVYWEVDDFTLPELWSASLNRTKLPLVTLKTSSPLLLYIAFPTEDTLQ